MCVGWGCVLIFLCCDDGGTFNITLTDLPLSRASPLPQDLCRTQILYMPAPPVGAGLPAMAACQPTSLPPNVPTPSVCEPAREAVDLAVAVAVAVALAFDLDLPPLSQRPNVGIAQGAPRQGCRGSRPRPWMADGGGPPEQCRSEGMPSLSEAPNGGAEALWLLSRFSKVTRCKKRNQ